MVTNQTENYSLLTADPNKSLLEQMNVASLL
jgi:hypothetical protein